jgi:hypothetical protein
MLSLILYLKSSTIDEMRRRLLLLLTSKKEKLKGHPICLDFNLYITSYFYSADSFLVFSRDDSDIMLQSNYYSDDFTSSRSNQTCLFFILHLDFSCGLVSSLVATLYPSSKAMSYLFIYLY